MTQLRASPRMYPWEPRRPPEGTIFGAVPQRRCGERCRVWPSSPFPLPFREPARLGGGGEGVSVGLESPSPPASSARSLGRRCTRESPAPHGPDPSRRTFVVPAPCGSGVAGEDPPWIFEQVPGVQVRCRCGPWRPGAPRRAPRGCLLLRV
jgi:hypothetical protein